MSGRAGTQTQLYVTLNLILFHRLSCLPFMIVPKLHCVLLCLSQPLPTSSVHVVRGGPGRAHQSEPL